jgi:hypothetical protein
MGRKWTNIKFVLEDRDASIVEASSNPKTQEETLYNFLQERWDTENVSPVENIDVMFGGPSEEKLDGWLNEILEVCPFVEKIAVVFVTDSAHIGYGRVLENDDGEVEVIEEYSGYEGARGNDVAGMIYDDFRIKVNPDWYWD